MTNETMTEAFSRAYDEGFITNLEDPEYGCNSDCDECPCGGELGVCLYLSEDKHFSEFVKNMRVLESTETYQNMARSKND